MTERAQRRELPRTFTADVLVRLVMEVEVIATTAALLTVRLEEASSTSLPLLGTEVVGVVRTVLRAVGFTVDGHPGRRGASGPLPAADGQLLDVDLVLIPPVVARLASHQVASVSVIAASKDGDGHGRGLRLRAVPRPLLYPPILPHIRVDCPSQPATRRSYGSSRTRIVSRIEGSKSVVE